MRNKFVDKSGDKNYFSIIPNYIVNHSTHWEKSLYLTLKRITGEEGSCWMSPTNLAKIEGCSANKIRETLDSLERRKWIKKIGKRGKTKPTNEYVIIDLWHLNNEYYKKKESSPSEQSKKKVHPVNIESSPGGNKEEPIKKNNNNINIIIAEFEPINPSYETLFQNKTQRAAIERLINLMGEERLINLVRGLPRLRKQKYAPVITTPYQLEQKLGQLMAFIEKQNNSKIGVV